jgi:hypothetical protein
MSLLSREQLLTKQTPTIKKIELLTPDEFVYVRQMSGRERDIFERSLLIEVEDKQGNITYKRVLEDFRAKLATHTVCDENGVLLLKSSDASTLSESMLAACLEKIVDAAQELNRITEKDKEALIKNSVASQTAGNTSESPAVADSPIPISGSTN